MKVAILGTGKMGGALGLGLVKAGVVGLNNLIGCNSSERGRLYFQSLFHSEPVVTCADLKDWLPYLDVIIISIKPQQMKVGIASLQGYRPETLFISVAAGLRTTQLEALLGGSPRVIRAMPNTPCLVREGVSAYCAGQYAKPEDLQVAEQFLGSVGAVCAVPEEQMNIVTSLSGCGPAYAFHFLNGLIDGAVKLGLSPELARVLAVQTVRGAMGLMAQSSLSPIELATQVKSPGGVTIAGCAVLEEAQVERTLHEVIAAAKKRADELAADS